MHKVVVGEINIAFGSYNRCNPEFILGYENNRRCPILEYRAYRRPVIEYSRGISVNRLKIPPTQYH
jgi:hypothetical protein